LGGVVKLLLLLPFVGLLWIPFYNQAEPALFGFPFFYWYQLLWVPISSLLTFAVWRLTRRSDTP
jgi:tryptophan-rich sensory protein